ncbi:MAG: flagellin [Pseudomonadota bacterium]
MTRVSDANQSQVLLMEVMRANRALQTTQDQVATGKAVDTFQDLKGDTSALLSSKRLLQQTEQYDIITKRVNQQLETQDLHLSEVYNAVDGLVQQLTEALTQGEAQAFMDGVESAFDRVVSVLNSQADGKYLYGGTLSDSAPVTLTTLDDLGLAAASGDAFRDNTREPTVRLDATVSIKPGFLAGDIGGEVMQQIKAIKDYNDGTAAFDGPLTDAQINELSARLDALKTAADGVSTKLAINGNNQRLADDMLLRHEASRITLTNLVSDIEDVDMAEALTRLNQDQIKLEASMRVLSQLNNLSLMNFL